MGGGREEVLTLRVLLEPPGFQAKPDLGRVEAQHLDVGRG
jgi:hypothetical protein